MVGRVSATFLHTSLWEGEEAATTTAVRLPVCAAIAATAAVVVRVGEGLILRPALLSVLQLAPPLPPLLLPLVVVVVGQVVELL